MFLLWSQTVEISDRSSDTDVTSPRLTLPAARALSLVRARVPVEFQRKQVEQTHLRLSLTDPGRDSTPSEDAVRTGRFVSLALIGFYRFFIPDRSI